MESIRDRTSKPLANLLGMMTPTIWCKSKAKKNILIKSSKSKILNHSFKMLTEKHTDLYEGVLVQIWTVKFLNKLSIIFQNHEKP